MAKRLFDILASAFALLLLWPLLLALAVWVRIDSPGAAIFKQRRIGWRGRPFPMWKFRSMRTDVDPYGMSPSASEDPRLTKAGRFLRETSLDELPQLVNILRGDMSIVGPRPLYERQAEEWNERQRHRLDVRPGLTGYAQVVGRASLPIEDKIEMDLYYVEHRSFWLDLKLIWQTAMMALRGRGEIYEQQYSRDKQRERDQEESVDQET